ncbi:hypothetical protein VTO73DRAFT_1091 [Trametes versicolor]
MTTTMPTSPVSGELYEDVLRRSAACAPFVVRPGTEGLERQTIQGHLTGPLRYRTLEGLTVFRGPRIPARLHEAQHPAGPWTVRSTTQVAGPGLDETSLDGAYGRSIGANAQMEHTTLEWSTARIVYGARRSSHRTLAGAGSERLKSVYGTLEEHPRTLE